MKWYGKYAMNIIKKHGILVLILSIPLILISVDLIIWRLDIKSNKKTVESITSQIAATSNSTSLGVYEQCRVSLNKTFRTTSCSVRQDVIIRPNTDLRDELSSVFSQLNRLSWDTNFEEFKTELLEGKSRFDDQKIRFYRDDYDPNGDHDFIDVYRVDNGITLKDTGVQSSTLTSDESNLVVLRVHYYQRSSLSHYIIGQFKNY